MAAVLCRRLPSTVALAVVVFALSLLAARLRPAGMDSPPWWPAAGVAVTWILRSGKPDRLQLLAVAAGSAAAAYAAGRPAPLAAALVLATCVEVFVVTWFVTRGGEGVFRFRAVGDVGRFFLAIVLDCLAGAVVAGTAVALLDGHTVPAWRFAAVAHGAAILLVAPVVLAPAATGRRSARARVELLLQWAGLLVVTLAVFSPGQRLPMAWLCLSVVVWTAVRSGARATAWQLLVQGVLVTAASAGGLGPFAASGGDPATMLGIAQLFVLVGSSTVLVLAVGMAEQERSRRLVAEREALYRGGFEDALLGMLLVGTGSGALTVLEVNAVGARLRGSTPEALVGTELSLGVHPHDVMAFEAGALDVAQGTAPAWRGEVRTGASGRMRWLDVSVAPSRDPRSDPVLSVQLVDATERHEAQEHLQRLALHDPLTGLPNRSLLLARLKRALDACSPGAFVGAAYVDLDGFKAIDDRAGHAAGDVVLVVTAERLQAVVQPGDTVARVGGDEFVVVFPSVSGEKDVRAVVDRLVVALAEPVSVDGSVHRVSASRGLAVGGAGTSATELLHAADVHMYQDKHLRRPLSATAP